MMKSLPFDMLRLTRDERGSALVELGFFIPIIATMLLGMMDLGQGLSARHNLQQAANRAMEVIMARTVTMDPTASEANYEFAKTEAASAAGVAAGDVVLTRWRECNGVPQATYNAVCPPDADGNAQEVARYLRIRINSGYRPMFDLGPFALSQSKLADGRIRMTAQAAIRIQ